MKDSQNQQTELEILQSSMKYSAVRKNQLQTKNSTSKKQQKFLHSLSVEVQQSRIAIDHIDYCRKDEQNQSQNVENVKNELKQCVVQINTQQKRQYVLKELVALLKGEMNKIQSKQLQVKQKEEAELDRALKELENDIDKISQKKNQQVAKISVLKENVNQSRSQRVVYSNLFKKIQRQLKQQEQTYKSELLKVEKTKFDLQISPNNKIKFSNDEQSKFNNNSWVGSSKGFNDQGLENKNTPSKDPKHSLIYLKQQKNQNKDQIQQIWLTNVPKNTSKQKEVKNEKNMYFNTNQRQNSFKSKNTAILVKTNRFNSTKQTIQHFSWMMEQLVKLSDRIKLMTSCQSVEEIIQLNDTILSKNEKLEKQIDDINDSIEEFKKQINKINKLSAQSHEIEFDQIDEINQQEGKKIVNSNLQKKKSLNCQMYRNGKENNMLNVTHNGRIKNLSNMSKGSFTSRTSEVQKSGQQIAQQFQQLCRFFTKPTKDQKQQKYIKQNPLNAGCIELEEQCKVIDQAVTQLWNYLNVKDNTLNQSKFYYDCSEIDKSQSIDGTEIQMLNNNNQKFNNVEQLKTNISQNNNRRESFLNTILNRMDKFGNCQKFLDREGFCGEYRKEINKKTKIKTKKN